MTKTEYTAAIGTTQATISAIRADLRKLRNIEKLSKSFPDLKLVDTTILDTTITAKKAELNKLRSDLSKARRIVKRMTEIEDIEAGKAGASKQRKSAKKSSGAAPKKTTEKKADAKPTPVKKQPAPARKTKENAVA